LFISCRLVDLVFRPCNCVLSCGVEAMVDFETISRICIKFSKLGLKCRLVPLWDQKCNLLKQNYIAWALEGMYYIDIELVHQCGCCGHVLMFMGSSLCHGETNLIHVATEYWARNALIEPILFILDKLSQVVCLLDR